MKLQYLCHMPVSLVLAGAIGIIGACAAAGPAWSDTPGADADASTALAAERAFLAVLEGSCRTPIAGHARVAGAQVRFRGLIAKPDGSLSFDAQRTGGASEAAALGRDAGRDLRARAGADFFTA